MTQNHGQEILDLFRRFQALNQFVALDPAWKLSLASSHALTESDSHRAISLAQLSRVLALPRVIVLSIVKKLRSEKFIEFAASTDDAREKLLKVSAGGRALLAKIDPPADVHLDKILGVISPLKRIKLKEFFGLLAQAHDIPRVPTRPSEHMIRGELRRATRALRLIHPDFSGSNMGSPEWQILSAVRATPGISPSAVAEALGIPLSTVTGQCARFKKDGLLISRIGKEDRRVSELSLSATGEKHLVKSERTMASKISIALRDTPSELLEEGLQIFREVVLPHDGNAAKLLRPGLEAVSLATPEARHEARTLAVELIVRRAWQHLCPESLCAGNDLIYGLVEKPGEALRGVCTFSKSLPCKLLLCVVDNQPESEEVFGGFLEASTRKAMAAVEADHVTVSPGLFKVLPVDALAKAGIVREGV